MVLTGDEIDSTKMQAKMEFVPIDQLANYADKKVRGSLSLWGLRLNR